MTTCSTVQIDSNPKRSAACARCAMSCGFANGPELANIKPSFMVMRFLSCDLCALIYLALAKGHKSTGRRLSASWRLRTLRPQSARICENSRRSFPLYPNGPSGYLLRHGYRNSWHLVLLRRDDGG